MKTDWRDIVAASLALILTFSLDFTVIAQLEPFLARWTGMLFPVIYLVLFILIFGIVMGLYLRVLMRAYPLHEGFYTPGHIQITLWKHHQFLGDLAAAALKPLDLVVSRVQYYWLLGLRVGRRVALGSVRITDPLLTEIRDLAVVGDGTIIGAHVLAYDKILLKRIIIGRGATIGAGSMIAPGVEVGDNSIVASLSRVDPNTKIPPGEYWEGIPARKVRDIPLGRHRFTEGVQSK